MKAVIQAGGMGTRLRPYTMVLPKPLMPVGDLPVIELLLKWLRRNGISEVIVTTGHLGHLIRSLLEDGSRWDMDITYSTETEPLGTVGALNLVRDQLNDTFLVLNGDLITDLNLRQFGHFHRNHKGLMSVATVTKQVNIDMGVIESSSQVIADFKEKPTLSYQVNMGVYCMEPSVLDWIPKGMPFGFDHLMYAFLDSDEPVHVFEHDGHWLDIGRPEDFARAQEYVETWDQSVREVLPAP